jgi:hypothetical protein
MPGMSGKAPRANKDLFDGRHSHRGVDNNGEFGQITAGAADFDGLQAHIAQGPRGDQEHQEQK